ncbi:helix-turn-helix domain-containing protein, partial [Micromonospora sp. LZ34]
MQAITASRSDWIHPFTDLRPIQFRRLVRLVAARGGSAIADGRPGRQWALNLADRVLLVAAYWRTNLTMRQLGLLFGVSHSAAHRVIDSLGRLLALAPVRRRPKDQIAIDANTRLVIALGNPQPGNRNDTVAYRTSG